MRERITIYFIPTSLLLILGLGIFSIFAGAAINIRSILVHGTAILFWGGLCMLAVGGILALFGRSHTDSALVGFLFGVGAFLDGLALVAVIFAIFVINVIYGILNFFSFAGANMEYISIKELILPWAYKQDKLDGLLEDIEEYMETGDMKSLSNEDIYNQFKKYGLKVADGERYICENQTQDNPEMIMYISRLNGECYGIYYGDYANGERTGNGTWYYEDQYGEWGMYIGEWENNYLNGQGKDASFEKDYGIIYYEGNFINGKYNGTFEVIWEYQKGKSIHATVDYENGIGIEADLGENVEDYRSYYHLNENEFIIGIAEEVDSNGMPVGVITSDLDRKAMGVGYALTR